MNDEIGKLKNRGVVTGLEKIKAESLQVGRNVNNWTFVAEGFGDRTPGFKPNDDGSVTIYLQHESPSEDQESIWLPAPNGPFTVALRIFWPEQEILDGK